MVMRIPGDLKDRRTPLGELSWIFTAVTDTIAWTSLPRETFNRLFRQDLLVAALFRNFLLAQRIMTTYHCTPMSVPEVPSTHNHPLWHSWDLAVDACLAQLPELLDIEVAREAGQSSLPPLSTYRPSTFFAQHLQAFEVWLQHGGSVPNSLSIQAKRGSLAHRPPPQQLPIVLQVLLSQAHRLRALILLSRFVDLGPWAVHLSLSIGIFPYVQKLLQSPAIELKPVLIFIWARILAVDRSCQVDLLRDSGYNYFAQILSPCPAVGAPLAIPNANEHRAMCAFILAILCRGFRPGQNACLAINIVENCIARLQEDDWLLKTWCLLCIAQIWADNDEGKALFMQGQRQAELFDALKSSAVEERAAALYAFGTLLGASAGPLDSTESRGGGGTGAQLGIAEGHQLEIELGIAIACVMTVKEDASPMVRKELIVVISCVVREWRGWMVCAAWAYYEQEATLASGESGMEGVEDVVSGAFADWGNNEHQTPEEHLRNLVMLSGFKVLFETLLDLSVDPHTGVALMASTVVDYIVALLLDSAFIRVAGSATQQLAMAKRRPTAASRQLSSAVTDVGRSQTTANTPAPTRTNTGVSEGGMKRSSSVANALRNLASITGLYPQESSESPSTPTYSTAQEYTEEPETPPLITYQSPYPDSTHKRIHPDHDPTHPLRHPSSLGVLSANAQMRARANLGMSLPPVSPGAVIDALTEEDMERLRIRRLKGTQAGGGADGRLGNNGLARPMELGLGMVAKEVKDDVLPLKSGFFDWAVEYFREPQMKVCRLPWTSGLRS